MKVVSNPGGVKWGKQTGVEYRGVGDMGAEKWKRWSAGE